MAQDIYQDNAAELGLRTRLFRNAVGGGVEWMYAVDHAAGDRRWYGFGACGESPTIESLIESGMSLTLQNEHA